MGDIVLLAHTSLGTYGQPTGRCPGCPEDGLSTNSSCCDVTFTSNWVHTTSGVFPPTTQASGSVPANSPWYHVSGNSVIKAEDPLPTLAENVVAAAGPRSNAMLNKDELFAYQINLHAVTFAFS